MELSDFEKIVIKTLNTEYGLAMLEMLEEKFVYTQIVQMDGEVPSSIRQGKSDLIRLFRNILNNTNK